MRLNLTFMAFSIILLSIHATYAASNDCTDCNKKTLPDSVKPDSSPVVELKKNVAPSLDMASKGELVLPKSIGRAPAVVKDNQISKDDYQDIYCHKFAQIEWQVITSLLDEMQATPYPIDDYFKTPACQPGGYSNVVKSPMAHIIADDPSKRVKFLDIMWLYYSKKRKEPAKFADFVNAKNTEGETLLDYFESRKKEPNYARIMKVDIDKIVAIACSHGAVYSVYKDKKCP